MNIQQIHLISLAWLCFSGCTWNENKDNRIYLTGKSFEYQVDYFNPSGKRLKTESLHLKVVGGFYPERKQTKIEWSLSQRASGSEYITESTGVVDSEGYFFLHPPRCGDLHILSFAEFPQIPGTSVTNPALGFKAEGKISMSKSHGGIQVNGVSTTRTYDGIQELIELPIGRLKVMPIKASASSEIGEIRGVYYFHPSLGFVRLDYQLPDLSSLSIYLTAESSE